MKPIIVAEYRADPYPVSVSAGMPGIPWVVRSNHPRFVPGTRFDYGFLQVALAQGYTVLIRTTGLSMSRVEREVYGEAPVTQYKKEVSNE